MRRAVVLTLVAVALSCSDRTGEQTGPSTIPPGPSLSRVVLSGTVSAAANESPIRNVRVAVVDGVNAGRETFSNDVGHYQLADLEPGTFTLLFSTGEYLDLQRTEVVGANTTLNVQLEKKGFLLSGVIKTQWGEPIGDVGVNALHEGKIMGGAGGERVAVPGGYRIPTLPAMDYIVRALKWGYVTQERPVTMTGDTTLDFVLDRVRVSMFGAVREATPCAGAIPDARVEIVSGPDAGVSASSTATGYQLKNGARVINWGKFTLRASKTGYVPAELSIEVLPPGWSCGTLPRPPESPSCPPGQISASSDVRQDFVLQRTGSC